MKLRKLKVNKDKRDEIQELLNKNKEDLDLILREDNEDYSKIFYDLIEREDNQDRYFVLVDCHI